MKSTKIPAKNLIALDRIKMFVNTYKCGFGIDEARDVVRCWNKLPRYMQSNSDLQLFVNTCENMLYSYDGALERLAELSKIYIERQERINKIIERK